MMLIPNKRKLSLLEKVNKAKGIKQMGKIIKR